MFKLKYNILVALQILFGLLNPVFMLKIFGVSVQSDSFLVANSIIISLQSVQNLFIAQFIFFYNDEKVISRESANRFYNSVLFFAVILGVISFFIYHFFINNIINIFALSIDSARFEMIRSILFYSTLMVVFSPLIYINKTILNAEMKFSIPYIFDFLPTACIVAAQIYLMLTFSKDVVLLAKAQAISSMLIGLIGTLYVSRKIIPFKLVFWHNNMPKFIKNSISISVGNSFCNIFLNIIINNFLAMFSQGIVSCYYYAKKLISLTVSFSMGPSINILRSNISKNIACKKLSLIIVFIKKYLKLSSVITLIIFPIVYVLISPLIKLVTENISASEILMIKMLFLGLIPCSFIETLSIPFSQFNNALKNSKCLYIANSVYIVIVFLILLVLKNQYGIYSVIPATLLGLICCNFIQFYYFYTGYKYRSNTCN